MGCCCRSGCCGGTASTKAPTEAPAKAMKAKKGEMSLQLVIGAVIALLILVLLVWIVGGKLGLFNKGASACVGRGGTCTSGSDCPAGKQHYYIGDSGCSNNQICCVTGEDLMEDLGQR